MKKYQLLEDSKLESVTGGSKGAFITGCVLAGVGAIPAITIGITGIALEIAHSVNTVGARDALRRGDVEASKRFSEEAANCMKHKFIAAGIAGASAAVAAVGAVLVRRNFEDVLLLGG